MGGPNWWYRARSISGPATVYPFRGTPSFGLLLLAWLRWKLQMVRPHVLAYDKPDWFTSLHTSPSRKEPPKAASHRVPSDGNHLSDTAGKRLHMRIFTNAMEAGKLSNDPGTTNSAENNQSGHWHSVTACIFRRRSTLYATRYIPMPPESDVRATLQLLWDVRTSHCPKLSLLHPPCRRAIHSALHIPMLEMKSSFEWQHVWLLLQGHRCPNRSRCS